MFDRQTSTILEYGEKQTNIKRAYGSKSLSKIEFKTQSSQTGNVFVLIFFLNYLNLEIILLLFEVSQGTHPN